MAPSSSRRQPAPDPPSLPRIPLAHKRVPTEMRAPHEHAQLLGAALVGTVDIAELRAELLALPESHWLEAHNRVHNVYFQRPFHDKLGVGNIMCVFSDTQLESVYTLPLYAHYRAHLERVFAAMDVHPDQVVRCLFARMPPGAFIPAHHDNGPWVSKTHRMHVPIVTFPEVAFCSGPLEESMTRYAFNEGTIVELNNAAKHSVANPTAHHRIHLIFDYVEASHAIARRVTLPAGQACRQVRGRVELVAAVDARADEQGKKLAGRQLAALETLVGERLGADAATALTTACRHYFIEQISAKQFVKAVEGSVLGRAAASVATADTAAASDSDSPAAFADALWSKLLAMFALVDARMRDELTSARETKLFAPNWVIIGAQKCGTTSLFEYLSQHPQAVRGGRREPHFFDWAWPAALQHALTQEERGAYEPVLARYSASARESVAGVPLEGNSLDDLRIKYLLSLQCARGSELQPPFQIGESTPSYLLYGEPVARRIKALYPDMKLLVMLRDPVKRAYSHYQMTADTSGSAAQLRMREAVKGKAFEQVVDEDLALLRAAGVSPASLLDGDDAALDQFQRYADALSQQHGAHAYVGRGLYALQLALWLRVFPREQLLLVDLDDMRDAAGTQRQVNRAFDFLGLPPHEVADTARKNTRAYDAIAPKLDAKLRAFYAPFNEQLFELVGRRFEW
ncbi:hypothetical protein PybrP1_011121 [[Pythium] brassicae (nom. inval.)]|nr:hypothetical protein PybrP1_011121 [[Pythium] brassicae (nom. inval.)]